MLTRERMDRMLSAPSYQEAAKLLCDCGYEDMSACSASGVDEALSRSDVPDLTRKLIACAAGGGMLSRIEYDGTFRYGPYTFYGTIGEDEEHDSAHRTV